MCLKNYYNINQNRQTIIKIICGRAYAEALESGMCDMFIKIRLKRRDATRRNGERKPTAKY